MGLHGLIHIDKMDIFCLWRFGYGIYNRQWCSIIGYNASGMFSDKLKLTSQTSPLLQILNSFAMPGLGLDNHH